MKNCDIFLIFAQNIDCGYTLEPVLTTTHNLCFRAKIKKNVYPCKPQFYYTEVGCKGVYITRTCFHDVWNYPHMDHVHEKADLKRCETFAFKYILKFTLSLIGKF